MQYANLHHVQRKILNSLAIDSPQRFSELQPAGLASNIFTYHLKKLRQTGYIEYTDRGYYSTRKGLKLIHFNDGDNTRKGPPKLLTMLHVQNSDNNILLIKRNNSPFKGWYGIPSGLIHHGESLYEAAQRELFEKTSIIPQQCLSELEISGFLDFRYVDNYTEDIFIHALAVIFKCTIKEELRAELLKSNYGELLWSDLKEKKILPEVYKIHHIVTQSNFGVESQVFPEPSGNSNFDIMLKIVPAACQ